MIGFQKVLVPLDGSPASEAAIAPALQSVAAGGTLYLLRVAHLVATNYLPEGSDKESLWEKQIKPVRDYLDQQAEALHRDDITVLPEVGSGPTEEVILDFAKTEGVDLVVMCTHAEAGIRHLLMGSVTTKVVKASPVPVMVIRP